MFRRELLLSLATLPAAALPCRGAVTPAEVEPEQLPITAQELAELEFKALVADFPDTWESVAYCDSIKLDRWFSAIYCIGAGRLLDRWSVRIEGAMNKYKLRVFDLGKAGPLPLEEYADGYAPSTLLIVGRESWEQEAVQRFLADLHAKFPRPEAKQ